MSKFKDYFRDTVAKIAAERAAREAGRAALLDYHAQGSPRVVGFEQEAGIERGGTWSGTYGAGVALLSKYFKPKARTLPGSLKVLEDRFGPILWYHMEIKPKVTLRGNQFDGVRSDVTVTGTIVKSAKHVEFRYMQGNSGYSGYRMFRYDGGALKLFTALDRRIGFPSDRARDKFDMKS